MDNYTIDINADVGEGIGNENGLMPFLSSCNIACGGHAGDEVSMINTIKLAKQYKVKIGAHPSFPDKDNFGRHIMEMSDNTLFKSLLCQVLKLKSIVETEGLSLHHIKPHGALYNLAAKDKVTAKVIIDVVKELALPIKLYAPFNSVIAKQAKREGIKVAYEAFADRNYNDDLSLVSRQKSNAILHSKEAALNHVLGIIKHQKITSINRVDVMLKATTICVHGDTENALEILSYLATNLEINNIKIR